MIAATAAGDERDLLEIMGDLMDNACKYGGTYVRISAVDGALVLVQFAQPA